MNRKGLPWVGLDSEDRPHAAHVLFAPEQKQDVVAAIHRTVPVRKALRAVPGQRGLQTIILTAPAYLPGDLRALYECFDAEFAFGPKGTGI